MQGWSCEWGWMQVHEGPRALAGISRLLTRWQPKRDMPVSPDACSPCRVAPFNTTAGKYPGQTLHRNANLTGIHLVYAKAISFRTPSSPFIKLSFQECTVARNQVRQAGRSRWHAWRQRMGGALTQPTTIISAAEWRMWQLLWEAPVAPCPWCLHALPPAPPLHRQLVLFGAVAAQLNLAIEVRVVNSQILDNMLVAATAASVGGSGSASLDMSGSDVSGNMVAAAGALAISNSASASASGTGGSARSNGLVAAGFVASGSQASARADFTTVQGSGNEAMVAGLPFINQPMVTSIIRTVMDAGKQPWQRDEGQPALSAEADEPVHWC